MHRDLKWTDAEKKQARKAFEMALQNELNEILDDFKRKAAGADVEGMWTIGEYLEKRRREIDAKYDYRYSQLISVFGRLLRESRITEEQLNKLDSEKMDYIKMIASF